MINNKNEGLKYIQQYPRLRKWINTCICCGAVGYNPNMPETLTRRDKMRQGEYETLSAYNIRKYFNPMAVNDMGLCEDCQKMRENIGSSVLSVKT
jgi:hypothetical protein